MDMNKRAKSRFILLCVGMTIIMALSASSAILAANNLGKIYSFFVLDYFFIGFMAGLSLLVFIMVIGGKHTEEKEKLNEEKKD